MDNGYGFAKAAAIRAIRTFAQTAAGIVSAGILLSDIDWISLASASVLAMIYSILMSLAGLPEVGE